MIYSPLYLLHKHTLPLLFFFFFNDTATTEIYTLSLHDALPIYTLGPGPSANICTRGVEGTTAAAHSVAFADRKSTRLNSSHGYISYAVFCLKKKKIYLVIPNRHTYSI